MQLFWSFVSFLISYYSILGSSSFVFWLIYSTTCLNLKYFTATIAVPVTIAVEITRGAPKAEAKQAIPISI